MPPSLEICRGFRFNSPEKRFRVRHLAGGLSGRRRIHVFPQTRSPRNAGIPAAADHHVRARRHQHRHDPGCHQFGRAGGGRRQAQPLCGGDVRRRAVPVHEDTELHPDHHHRGNRGDHPQSAPAPDGSRAALRARPAGIDRPRRDHRRHHPGDGGAHASEQHAGVHRPGRGPDLLRRRLRRLFVAARFRAERGDRGRGRRDVPGQEPAARRRLARGVGMGKSPVRAPARPPGRVQGGQAQHGAQRRSVRGHRGSLAHGRQHQDPGPGRDLQTDGFSRRVRSMPCSVPSCSSFPR